MKSPCGRPSRSKPPRRRRRPYRLPPCRREGPGDADPAETPAARFAGAVRSRATQPHRSRDKLLGNVETHSRRETTSQGRHPGDQAGRHRRHAQSPCPWHPADVPHDPSRVARTQNRASHTLGHDGNLWTNVLTANEFRRETAQHDVGRVDSVILLSTAGTLGYVKSAVGVTSARLRGHLEEG